MKPNLPRGAVTLSLAFALACAGPHGKPEPTAQDVHGLGIHNLYTPLPGVLASGQPTREQLAKLTSLGFKTFINLRAPGEPDTGWEADYARSLGARYVQIPVRGAEDLTQANASALDAALRDAEGGRALVYCRSSNRVGALLALKARWVDGMSAEAALRIGKAGGLRKLEPAVVKKIEGT